MIDLVLAILLSLPLTAASSGVAFPGAQAPGVPTPDAAREQPWPPPGVQRPVGDVTLPRIVTEVKPSYTAGAMREKIQGSVKVEAVVQPNGEVGQVRVIRSLDSRFGLDDEAVKAVKGWRFAPGTKDGKAVAVLVEIELTFTLGKPQRPKDRP